MRSTVTPVSQREMGRALGVLYLCGAALAGLWTLLPHGARDGDPVVLAMAVLAAALGLGLVQGIADRAPLWVFHLVIGMIQVVIAVGFAAPGAAENDIRLFFLWATPFAAFFFAPRAALGTACGPRAASRCR